MAEKQMIYELLAKVAAGLPAVPKTESMKDYSGREQYKFRGITDVIDAIHGPMAKAGIVVVPEVLDILRQEAGQTKAGTPTLHLIVRYAHTFFAPDGSSVRAVTLGEGIDTSDKAANKCHSAALKYALNEVLMLAYDVEEQDAERPDQPVAAAKPAPAATAAVQSVRQQAAVRPAPPAPKPAPAPKAPACPSCGSAMALRKGKNGDFWGCTMFRQTGCKGTASVPKDQPATPPSDAPGTIGTAGANRISEAMKNYSAQQNCDSVAVRNFLYGRYGVRQFADLTAEQEHEIIENFKKEPATADLFEEGGDQ